MKKLLLVVAGVLCLAGSVFARSLQLTRGETGLWSDPTMWYDKNDAAQHYAPQPGDSLSLTAYWDISVTLDGAVSMPFSMTTSARADKVLSFHGDGYVLESSGDDIAANPFYLYSPHNHAFQYLRAAGSGTAFRFDDPEITVSNATGVSYFDFHSGTFNFYDPNESVNDGPINLFALATDRVEVVFGKDATARLGSTVLAANGTTTVGDSALRFEGGSHYLKEILWAPNYAPPHAMVVSAKGGAYLTADKVDLSNKSPGASGAVVGQKVRTILDLSDGARLDVGADGLSAKATNQYVEPEVRLDHATLASDGTADLNFAISANPGTNRFTAVDSTIAWTNGAFTCGYFASATPKTATLGAFTNTTFVAKTFSFYTGGDFVFKDCHVEASTHGNSMFGNRGTYTPEATVVFDHCTVTNAMLRSYPDGLTGGMRFTGGTEADLWDLSLQAACDVRIDGGSRVNCMVNSGNRFFCNSYGTCILTVSNASFSASKAHCYMGYNALAPGKDACGILRVQDGAYVYFGGKNSDTACLYAGYKARGRVEVSGGELWSSCLYFGNQAKGYESDEPTTLLMTGGEVHTGSSDDSYGMTFSDGAGQGTACILNGGKLYAHRILGRSAGVASFSADGGTIVVTRDVSGRNNPEYHLLTGFQTAELGPKGLTVDSQKKAIISQSMADKDGEQGLFRKIGPADLLFAPTAWSVSETRVEEGAFQVTPATLAMETTLVVTNGATFSLAGGATAVTLDGLTVAHGTIALDAGDTITVPADRISISGLTLKFSSDPAAATSNAFLVATGGAIPEDVAWQLRRAWVDNVMPAGNHASLVFEFDEGTGRTTVKVAVTADVAPLTDETSWQSAAPDGWMTPESWTDGVPTAGKIAVFAETPRVSKTVAVPEGAKAGAMAFRADGYALEGERLEIAAEQGAARIDTADGTNAVTAAMRLDARTAVATEAGSKLTLAGTVEGFGFDKTGKGELELGGTNAFYQPLSQNAGRILVRTAESLGADDVEKRVSLTGGTIAFESADGAEMRIENPITVSAPETRGAAILDCRTPVTLTEWRTTEQGGLIKRGAAPLTIEVGGDMQLNAKCAMSAISYIPATAFTFDGDGTAPDGASAPSATHYYAGFNVAEGEVAFRARSGLAARPQITTKCGVMPCLVTTSGTATPMLTLDGVDLVLPAGNAFVNGADLKKDNVISQSPVVRIVNGARLYANHLQLKRYGYSAGCQPICAITNGTLQAKGEFWFDYINVDGVNQKQDSYTILRAKDAEILADSGKFNHNGGVRADLVNTYFGPADKTAYGALGVTNVTAHAARSSGEILFRDGSVCRIGSFFFPATDWKPTPDWAVMTLAFDDAEWQYGAGDWTLSKEWFAADYRDHFVVETRGKGLILKPAAGTTFTTEMPISGSGDLVVDGPGTVKFNAGTLAFTGTACVRQGTLDAGGQAVTIRIQPGETVPMLKDCAPKGKIQVDMGGAVCEKGATFTVARISGSTPLKFKAVNFADPELYGYFTVQDGLVTMTIGDKPGLSVIVR